MLDHVNPFLLKNKKNTMLPFDHAESFVSRYVLIDTPGQIEVFTWSASGTIITESLVGPLHIASDLL